MASTPAEPVILVSYPSPSIAKITLNRPRSLNAINADLLKDLVDALRSACTERKRVIILEGAGDCSFCAGEDLKETLAPKTGSPAELREAFELLQDITRLTASSNVLVIAAVQGFAVGGGAEIALAADFVIGGPGAKFRFPEVFLGHAATGGITMRLTQMVGLLKAKELLLRGQFVAAEEALRIGLLTELVADPKARALELAIELGNLPPTSASTSKAILERAAFPNMESNLADEINVASYCFAQGDATRAFENFAARNRKPGKDHSETLERGQQGYVPCAQDVPVGAYEATKSSPSSIKDINTAFEIAVRRFPDRIFLRFSGKDYSFKETNMSVAKLAGGMVQRGVARGDRVMVMMKNSVEMVHTWLATNRIAAIWVPINVELRSLTLQHVVDSAHAKLVVLDSEFVDIFRTVQLGEQCQIYVKDMGENGFEPLSALCNLGEPVLSPEKVKPSDTAGFLYTSGTTGKSKPCTLSYHYFILQGVALVETLSLRPEDVLFCPFPLFHIDATALTTIPAMLLGAIAAFSDRFSASRFWEQVREAKATVYNFMGATLALTYKQPPKPRDRDHSVRLAWGVPIPSFAEDYERRFGHPLYTLYGSVEAGVPIMQQRSRVAGSCGSLRPGFQLRIADAADEPVTPANAVGQLLLRSDVPNSFFQGYFGSPAATVETFSNQWLHTGDLAKIDDDGNVYFVGRLKDVIRRRGENVNAAEVEEEFLRHPDVVVAAAHAIPSQLGTGTEDDLKISAKLCDGSTLDEASLFDWAVRNLTRFQVPTVIEIVTDLKRTPTGKIERSSLRAEGGERFNIRDWRDTKI